jgi:hypothetical protein
LFHKPLYKKKIRLHAMLSKDMFRKTKIAVNP